LLTNPQTLTANPRDDFRKLTEKVEAVLEKERGTVRKPWAGRISVCLIYPNTYHVGMSNLGFQTVYQSFNEDEGVVCERAFLPIPRTSGNIRKVTPPLLP